MKLTHNNTKLLVIAFIGSLIFHSLIIFALDFRFETSEREQRVLNVQLVSQFRSPSAESGTPQQEHDVSLETLDPVMPNSSPETITKRESSDQESSNGQLERDSHLDSDRSADSVVKNLELTDTSTDIVNVLEPNPTSDEHPQLSMQELLKTATAIVREQSSKQIVRNIEDDDDLSTEEEYYLKAWLKKVQEIGQLNYPQEAVEKKLYGKLRLYVSIKPDGSVKETRIVRSSGQKVLDEAAKNIVDIASPFSAFPPAMRDSLDLLEIVREWEFRKEALVPSTDTEED